MDSLKESILADAILNAGSDEFINAVAEGVEVNNDCEAYAIQDQINLALGGVAGWKVAVAPDEVIRCAALPNKRVMASASDLAVAVRSDTRIEVELGFRFDHHIVGEGLPATVDEMLSSLKTVFPVFELVSSRFSPALQARNKFTLADHQNNMATILGIDAVPFSKSRPPKFLKLRVGSEVSSFEISEARLERIFSSLFWLCHHADNRGRPIVPEDFIITGALIGPTPLRYGIPYRAVLDESAECFASFTHAQA